MTLRLSLAPEHCTVLGYRVKDANDPRWAGLFFEHATLADAAPNWKRLDVPRGHPESCVQYPVRSRYEPGHRYRFTIDGRACFRKVASVGFEKSAAGWEIVLGFEEEKDG